MSHRKPAGSGPPIGGNPLARPGGGRLAGVLARTGADWRGLAAGCDRRIAESVEQRFEAIVYDDWRWGRNIPSDRHDLGRFDARDGQFDLKR